MDESVILLLVVVGAFGLIAYWKERESRNLQEQLDSYREAFKAQLEQEKYLIERLQQPWGAAETTEEAEKRGLGIDLLEQLDSEWLESDNSQVPFDEDLVELGGTE